MVVRDSVSDGRGRGGESSVGAEGSGDGVTEKFLMVALRRCGNMKVKMA